MSNHSLRDFLRTAKKQLHDGQRNKTPVTLVMGNDKADIDTIAATLIFAYLRSLAPPSGAFSQHYIPLIQVGRNELSSVLHLTRLLPHLGLEAADLLVLDDMALDGAQSHLSVENTRLFLINWNILVGRQGENYARNIEGCIDIHRDEGYVPAQTTDLRIIGQAGSCTSLVVNALREEWQSIGGPGATDKHLASLGLGGVMVPTKNLQSATQEDEAAYRFLEGQYGNGYDRSSFYGGLIGEDSTSRQAPTYTEAAPAQAIGSDIGSISQSRTAAAPPTSTGEGDVHNTFTGNRLDPQAHETVQSFHEEVLPEHVHGSTGQHLTGTLASGYGGSGSTSTGGYGQGSSTYDNTSSSGLGGSSTGLGSSTTGYDNTSSSGLGTSSTTLGNDSYSSSSQYGNSNIDSAGLGSTLKSHGVDSTGLTSGNYGTGLSGSTDDYTSSTGATGASQRSYAPGTTSSTTEHDSSSGGGILSSVMGALGLGGSHQQSQDASHPGTSGIGGTGYSSGTTGGVGSSYDNTSSTSGLGSSNTGYDNTSSTSGLGSSNTGYEQSSGNSYGSATGTGSSNYGSSGTSGVAGTSSYGNTGSSGNYGSGSDSYSNSGSGNYGSNAQGIPTRDGEESSYGNTTGSSGRDESSYGNSGSSVQDTAKELAGNTRFGGESTGTGNGAPTTKNETSSGSGVHF